MANVPIVTEVTKAQLDVLVAANGLNEGLQYKVTDKDWLLIATSSNTYIFSASIPYLSYTAFLNQNEITDPVVATVVENSIGNIVWTRTAVGTYEATLIGAFPVDKTSVMVGRRFNYNVDVVNVRISVDSTTNIIALLLTDSVFSAVDGELFNTDIQIRVYQ